jgi:serine/threonine-protein kinase
LKLLSSEYQSDPTVVGQFRREAAAGLQVSHPHLSSVLSARVADPPYYLVMPWLGGANLRELIHGGGNLCLPEMLCIARQAAEAIAALWRAGWTHGDVKPENIVVSPPLHATLIDLGFARRADEPGWAAEPYFCGTLDYVAPEVIVSASPPDIRSDLYSLGVTMYELISGRLPYTAATAAEIARRRVEDLPADIHKLEPELPLDLVRLLRALLAKQPLRRPQSPEDVVQRLARLEIETFAERTSMRKR